MEETLAIKIEKGEESILKNWQLFICITACYLTITLINNKVIMTRDVYEILLSDKIESYRIDDYYAFLKRLSVYGYLALPLLVWLKITFIALIIQTPLMLKDFEVSFNETFKIAAYANVPFIILGIVRLIILFAVPKFEYTNDLLSLIPGSITNFINQEAYSDIAYKFLDSINIYEAAWVLILYIGIARLKKIAKPDAFVIVFGIWIGLTIVQLLMLYYLSNAI